MKSGSTKSIKNSQKDTSETKVDLIWLWHSCLYGHKENLKKILLNFSNLIKINETRVNGNTALHLGIFGNHLPVTQILLGKVCEKMSSEKSKMIFAEISHIRLLKYKDFVSKIWPRQPQRPWKWLHQNFIYSFLSLKMIEKHLKSYDFCWNLNERSNDFSRAGLL